MAISNTNKNRYNTDNKNTASSRGIGGIIGGIIGGPAGGIIGGAIDGILSGGSSSNRPSGGSSSRPSGGGSSSGGGFDQLWKPGQTGGAGSSLPGYGGGTTTGGKPSYTAPKYDSDFMSPEDLELVNKYTQMWQDAKDRGDRQGMDSAHAAAEAIRNKYGYSGGGAGNEFIQIPGWIRPEKFPEYESMYGDQIDAILGDITSSSFEDWASGSDYQYLYDKYSAGGEKAMQDVLGQLAARTGGYASSYATAAAGQAYNDYMTTLEDAARSMYQDEINRKLQNAGLLQDLEQSNYNQYLDRLNQWNTDRNFAYNQYLNNRDYEYGISRDEVEDSRYEDETEYNKMLQRAETLAAYGDFSGYKDLGYSDAQIQMMQAAYQSQMASKRSSGSTSSGSSKSSSSSSKPRLTASQTLQAIENGLRNDQVMSAYEYWFGESYRDAGQQNTNSSKTSLNFDEDEGIFTWNGKRYSSSQQLVNDIESANLTDSEKEELKRKFSIFGFDIQF